MPQWENILNVLNTDSAYVNHHLITAGMVYHSHDFVEIAYVAKGNGIHLVNGKEYNVAEGDIFLINYDTKHAFAAKNGSLLLYNCIFTPSYFNRELNGSRNFFDITDRFLIGDLYANFSTDYIFASARGGEAQHILNIYERLFHEFNTKQIGYRDIMRGYIIELLVIICRLNLNVNSERTQKMLEIIEHVNVHYMERICAEELALIAGFSVSHFRRVFKSLTGKTLNLYIQNIRIHEACRLLKSRDMNVEQVAEAVGYSDMKHFYSVFKRITGKLPKDFR